MNNDIDHLSDWQIHLSDWQIEELLIGPGGAPVGGKAETAAQFLHLEQCPLCSAKKQGLEAGLLLYREAALIQAKDAFERTSATNSIAAQKMQSFFPYHLLWGWNARVLAALLLLIALLPAFLVRERGHRETRQTTNYVARQQIQDDLLLQQVDQEITESVPQPMQSLTQPLLNEGSEQR